MRMIRLRTKYFRKVRIITNVPQSHYALPSGFIKRIHPPGLSREEEGGEEGLPVYGAAVITWCFGPINDHDQRPQEDKDE